ncbi:MAG TPA: 4-(cytidine 5'-diphospho)-2-C-methyl-D-erythritol kinase [Acidimicrobiia bacterium]|nr:4-(cytidine 5'-diphospho)-2-C-methyl-D-erythritol kinase [Acidimicrobiia bacterium]
MSSYLAPAKLNLSLHVQPPRGDGYHELESLVQTIEWCDRLTVTPGEEGVDTFQSDFDEDLVQRALGELRKSHDVPPLALSLFKEIPVAAGLGGGSSDAAAALVAGAEFGGIARDRLAAVASSVGADVPLFLTGGTLMMRGIGEELEPLEPLDDFAVAIVVPHFGLETAEVYRRWDEMEGPTGSPLADAGLPPTLRGGMPMRNDLFPAAVDLEPRLGDFAADIASVWGTAVSMTGSGSACFGYFATDDEAADAAAVVADLAAEGRGVGLRPEGIARLDDPVDD